MNYKYWTDNRAGLIRYIYRLK